MATAKTELNIAALSGSPYRAILKLATPTVFAMLSQSAVNEIDVVFFSRLPCPESSTGQAALLPSLILVWLFGGSISAVSVGTQALTARRYAERDYDAAGAILANAMWFCLLAGGFLSLFGLLVLPHLVSVWIKVPAVQEVVIDYSRYRMCGVISMGMTMGIKGFFDGVGRTQVHLVAAVVMNVLNVLLCYTFIFGSFGAPRLGAPGAGLAAFASTWVGLFIMLFYAWSVRTQYRFWRWSTISRKLTWDILKLSIPAAAATVTMMIGFGLFAFIVARLDADPRAASRVLSECGEAEPVNSAATTNIVAILKLTFTACIAFGTATATLVGQSLGAKRPDDAATFGWASVRLGLVIFGVVGVCEGILFTREIVEFISHSDAVREVSMTPMRIMGIVTPIIAVAMILSEALFGAGNTKFVAAAQLCMIFGWLVPFSYVLGIQLHFGLLGIWSAACAYAVIAAVTMTAKFAGGGWKRIKL